MPVLKAATTSTVPRKTNRSCFARLPMVGGPSSIDRALDRLRRGGADLADRHLGQYLAHDRIGVDLAEGRLALDDEPMGEDGDRQLLDVVGDDVVAALERG